MTSERARQASGPLFRTVHLLSSINPPQCQKSIEITQSYIHWTFPHSFYKCVYCVWVCCNCHNAALSYDPHLDRDHSYIFPLSIAYLLP